MTLTTTAPPTAPSPRPTTAAPGYVPEIQGLRTIALLLVATFHVWSGGVSGGVDVFLFVSAYLMTRSLAAAAEQGRATRPIAFLVRKLARIVPIAAIVALLTLVAVWLVLPQRTWAGASVDAVASVTYWLNVDMQMSAADYYDLDRLATSPFQQFWSLSIQGQVFAMWPLLHLAGERAARRFGWSVRGTMLVVFAVIGAASFAWAVVSIGGNAAAAYFDTWTRLWEFAAGSVLALVQPWVRLPDRVRDVASLVGLVGVVSCGFVLPDDARFPGPWALWPIASAALIVLGAGSSSRLGAGRLLSSRLLGDLGGYTYALYLVHWPILVIGLRVLERPETNALTGALLLALSAAATVVLVRWAERPIARFVRGGARTGGRADADGRRRSLVVIAATVVPVLVASAAGLLVVDRLRAQAETGLAAARAEIGGLGAQDPGGPTAPPLAPADLLVRTLWTESGADCGPDAAWRSDVCLQIGDPATASHDLLVLGNSHSMHFNGMLFETVERQDDWSVRTQLGPGCPFFDPDGDVDAAAAGADAECVRMWTAGTGYALEAQPDLVVVVGTTSVADAPDVVPAGLPEWVERITASGVTDVVVLRDNPRFDFAPYECATLTDFDDPACAGAAVPASPEVDALADGVRAAGGVWVDLNEAICPGGVCRPSMGGLVTYVDDNHLTEVFSRSLGERFTHAVRDELDWWPRTTFG